MVRSKVVGRRRLSRNIAVIAGLGAAVVTAASCAIDLEGTGVSQPSPPELDATRPEDAFVSFDAPVSDDSAADATDAADAADAPVEAGLRCPIGKGPVMISVDDRFCIDSTEVTNAHYAAFLDAGLGSLSAPGFCSWNSTYVPGAWDAAARPENANLPVVTVDWCDAYMFCVWSGKRLCGAIDGGPAPQERSAEPGVSQWMYACTGGDGGRAYPYGDTFDASACQSGGSSVVDAASRAGCQGGFAGIFDMSGNAAEWEDSCQHYADAGGDTVVCNQRGGSWGSTPAQVACDGGFIGARAATYDYVGFRCCYP